MARGTVTKKTTQKRREKQSSDSLPSSISHEALRGVAAIFLIALSGFLVMALLGLGGAFGAATFSGLSWLLGIGYILLPLSLFLLAIATVRSLERRLGWVQGVSMAIFLLSALAIVSIAFPTRGGALGDLISRPILSAFDTTATVFFLLAFAVSSLVVSFDIHVAELIASMNGLFPRRTREDDATEPVATVPAITGMPTDDTEEEVVPAPKAIPEPEEDMEEAAPPAPKEKAARIQEMPQGDENQGGFPIAAHLGAAYSPPPMTLLGKNKGKPEVGDVKANMNIIKRTLQNFGIQVEMDEASIGPTVTRYSMKPAEGVRLSKIIALQSNLELALAASPIRIEAPIPGKSLVGIEVPNIARTTLGLGPLIADEGFSGSEKPLMIALGRTITGQAQFADLAKMPHLLVAGTTGSGKSVTIHNFIISLLYRCGPERLRFIMIDPKRVELTLYNSIPHLLTPVITDAKKAILALKWLAKEMDRRYNILETERVRDIASYHQSVLAPALEKAAKNGGESDKPLPEAMPYIVLFIDELADIMQTYPRELEGGIVRLAQMSRAVGIHLVLSTQRPSVKVITGLIKANVPSRVALQVASQIDSRTILDGSGAEKLLGAGDMLFLSGEMSKPRRIQAAYISEDELKRVISFIAKQAEGSLPSEINFDEGAQRSNDPIFASMGDNMGDDSEDDELYPEAKKTVVEAGKASTSYLQRKLGVGYARAARLMDLLEDRGVIGPADGAKPRDVIGAGNADELAAEPPEQKEV
jgi:S-DNA-T family DNA segregation ATPase FtsK/SpoIIIE